MDKLTLLTYNCRGLNDAEKRKKLYLWLNDQNCDIICLQETFCTVKNEKFIKSNWNGKSIFGHTDSNHSRGVAILLNKNFKGTIVNSFASDDGRILLVNLDICDNILTIVSVYAPNYERDRSIFFEELRKWVSKFAENADNVIISGDFNCQLNLTDKSQNEATIDKSVEKLKYFLKNCNLNNCWFQCHGDKNCYTYYDKKTKKYSKLDYIFLSENINLTTHNIITGITNPIKNIGVTDHSALKATFSMNSLKKGPGYWKLNNSMLLDEGYIKLINKTIDESIQSSTCLKSHQLIWEFLKINIREESMKYCKIMSQRRRETQAELQHNLDDLCEKIVNIEKKNQLSQQDINELHHYRQHKSELEGKLNKFYTEKTRGYSIRARVKWINEGEIPTKYFLNLEKQLQTNNVIKRIKTARKEFSDDENILQEMRNFYTNLYKKQHVPDRLLKQYMDKVEIPRKLTTIEKTICEKHITQIELRNTIKSLKKNKSPGIDGLTYEFYQIFWEKLEPHFMSMINETFEKGHLPLSTRKAILRVIFKKGERNLLQNYRPISLNNCDYKIITFVLAHRLQTVISNIVSKDQSGYIKNRYIGCSARLINDIIEYCEKHQSPGALICLDFQKAFDSLNWDFMFCTLKKFGFGENFMKWIHILYTKSTFCVTNNGWISQDSVMERGIRQGCPISALLFILAVEILSIKVKGNSNIQGIQLFQNTPHIIQYADDTTLTLRDENSLTNTLEVLREFSHMSGLKLNLSKCAGLWLGNLKNNPDVFEGISFSTSPIKCLGIYIGHNDKDCEAANWEKKLADVDTLLLNWSKRKLTLLGKVVIINNLIIPKLIYNMTTLYMPDHIVKTLEKSIYSFLWDGAHKIKKCTMIQHYKNGGLNLTDIEAKHQAIKASWLPKLLNTNNKLGCILKGYLQRLGLTLDQVIQMNFRKTENFEAITFIPNFYQQILVSLNTCKKIKPSEKLTSTEFFSQPIWGNEYFKTRNQLLYLKNWVNSGILYVKDLFDKDGQFISERNILYTLQNTTNWISEYFILKNIFRKYTIHRFNPLDCLYLQPSLCKNIKCYIDGRFIHPADITTKDSYRTLIQKKYQRPYTEKMWQNRLGVEIESDRWKNIYVENLKILRYKKFSEFKFKILHNTLSSRYILSKWNKNVSPQCEYCGEIENMCHMIYTCPRVKQIWQDVSESLKLNIQLRHIILGLSNHNYVCENKMICIVLICHAIYSFWCICQNDDHHININIKSHIKQKLVFYGEVYNCILKGQQKENMISMINCLVHAL